MLKGYIDIFRNCVEKIPITQFVENLSPNNTQFELLIKRPDRVICPLSLPSISSTYGPKDIYVNQFV